MNDELSPAERMERFRNFQAREKSGVNSFVESLPFTPDSFQVEALEALAEGLSVLVAAPTGAGKTVVGEGGVHMALASGGRAFYTTPIKALSNQKFREFCDRFGSHRVGLLTGDTSINAQADVVVMTTEVLRNMIYAGADLRNLRMVVLDEIHYLADRVRGPVWEEVLIQLPEHVQTVSLSATVSNLEEFGQWLSEVRGNCKIVVSYRRPVPLYQHMMVGKRIYNLYADENAQARAESGAPPRLNSQLLADIAEHAPRKGRRPIPNRVNRPKVARAVQRAGFLPMIEFIFSRAACDEAVSSLLLEGLSFTTEKEQKQIAAIAEQATQAIPIADHGILGLASWQSALENGIAAHHAGMLPILKETVEKLFSSGLVKVVFATETLALGINMPARTVVIESLEKWNGSEHVRLSPGEYTQLTGRAGRRGIDVEGHAVVLGRGVVSAEEVAQLATRHSYPLKSAFFPGYNMVVNLLSRADVEQARRVLESSFAQFQADDAIVGLAAKLRKAEAKLYSVQERISCSKGDAAEYFGLREDLTRAQKELSRASREGNIVFATKTLRKSKPGQVIHYRKGRRWRSAVVVVGADRSFDTPLIRVVGEDAKVFTLSPADMTRGPHVMGHMRVPSGGARRLRDRQSVAKQVRSIAKNASHPREITNPIMLRLSEEISDIELRLRSHPVHSCPDRELHAVPGHEWVRLERECRRLRNQINSRTSSIAAEFDQVRQVLHKLKFLEADEVTARGTDLRRIFGERDLLVALAFSRGVFNQLTAQELAGFACCLAYEPRSDVGGMDPYIPTPALRQAWAELGKAFRDVLSAEKTAGLERTAAPAGDLIDITYRWAGGATLSSILPDAEITGGDFVRWMRQTVDLLQQLTRLGDAKFSARANEACSLLRRGVVAWSE